MRRLVQQGRITQLAQTESQVDYQRPNQEPQPSGFQLNAEGVAKQTAVLFHTLTVAEYQNQGSYGRLPDSANRAAEMESLYELIPQLDEQGTFWKQLRAKCLKGLTSVRWSTKELHWHPFLCKFHTYQNLWCQAVVRLGETAFEMKKKQSEQEPERYVFVVDYLLKNHEFSLEENKFLQQINLDEFILKNTWGVLHEPLIREALANLQEDSLSTTVQTKELPLVAADWRSQFQDVFHLTKRKTKASTQYTLSELFPSLKTATEGRETVKVTDCTYPGAKKPLRFLSSLFCLNTTAQNYIAVSFAELILAALNGQPVDWPEEFYQEFRGEVVKLHKKHAQNSVKVERTAIGPHITLMLKAAGVLNVPQVIEAGFHAAKSFTPSEGNPNPKKRKYTKAPPPSPPLHSTVKVMQSSPSRQNDPSFSTLPSTSETPRSVVVELDEPWQTPEAIPKIVEQVKQTHRRLENLLTTLASKAPPKLMKELDSQFYKLQREAILHEGTTLAEDSPDKLKSEIFKNHHTQYERLEKKLNDAEELNNLCIEDSFELQNQISQLQEERDKLQKEVQILTHSNQVHLTTIQDLEQANLQQFQTKETELAAMRAQLQHFSEEAAARSSYNHHTPEELRERTELNRLHSENRELKAALAAQKAIPNPKINSVFGHPAQRPLDRAERHALAEEATEQIYSDLQRELQVIKQEKEELQHQLQQGAPENRMTLPQTHVYPKSEIYQRLLHHTAPLSSIMQYHHAYGAIHLLTSNLPIIKAGITLSQEQFRELWQQANSRAKDTLAFMWAMGGIKLPLGSMEVVTGSPPFFIRRYILRSIAFLGQHQAIQIKEHPTNETLPSLRPYTHSQKIEIARLQQQHKIIFQDAINTLQGEDTAICFEATRRHQWLLEQFPRYSIPVTLPHLKEYVNQTLEEHQATITTRQFGTINNGTILRIGLPDRSRHNQPA